MVDCAILHTSFCRFSHHLWNKKNDFLQRCAPKFALSAPTESLPQFAPVHSARASHRSLGHRLEGDDSNLHTENHAPLSELNPVQQTHKITGAIGVDLSLDVDVSS